MRLRVVHSVLVGSMVVVLGVGFASAAEAKKRSVKLHPTKAACVDYKVAGQMMNGTMTRCHREHGNEQYEIRKMTVGFGGFTQSENKHVITIRETIYAIDLGTRQGTKTKNPMYEDLVKSMDGKSPKEMAKAFVEGMGFKRTAQNKKVAGHKCVVHESPQLGTVCLTDGGLMLEQVFMGNTTIAVKVEKNGGNAKHYRLHEEVKITEGPDLSKMPGMGLPQQR